MRYLVTGGAGFIGSAVCRLLAAYWRNRVVCLDRMTYAGHLGSLRSIETQSNYRFVHADICDEATILGLLRSEKIDRIVHLAAESHVDRSIDGPAAFVETNVVGTSRLLNASLQYWLDLPAARRAAFMFHHVSTDEVFGDLPFESGVFTEATPYAPSSPYSATKAASDHLVRAWHATYGLPTVISNCSNNYGPFQFPEKLIPLTILNAISGAPLQVYGRGTNVRDWIHVDDHARALSLIAAQGRPGETYLVGARAERTNLGIVKALCSILDRVHPRASGSYHDQMTFVSDRPAHDRRYAIDPGKMEREFGWKPRHAFEPGLAATVDWYLKNRWWWEPARTGSYRGERIGQARVAS